MLRGIIPSQRIIRQSVKTGIGVASGFVATPVASRIMAALNLSQYDNLVGLVHVIMGSLMVGMVRNKDVKDVGMMIAGFGAYDLVASNLKKADGTTWLPVLPRYTALTSALLPAPAPVSASYGVAMRPVSPVARAGVAASYRPALASSYEAPSMGPVGLAADMEAMGHLPGIDFD